MPLSTNAQVLETSEGLVGAFRGAAGDAPHSFRPGTQPLLTCLHSPRTHVDNTSY